MRNVGRMKNYSQARKINNLDSTIEPFIIWRVLMVTYIIPVLLGLLLVVQPIFPQGASTPVKPSLAIEELKLIKSSGILISEAELTKIVFEEIANSKNFTTKFLSADYAPDDVANADIVIEGAYELEGNLLTLNYVINLVKTKSRTKLKVTRMDLADIKKEVFANFKEIFVKITVTSDPVGCDLEMDGVPVGKTPISLENVITGTHLLHLTNENYFGLYQEVDISEDQSLSYTLVSQSSIVGSSPEPEGGIDAITGRIEYPSYLKNQKIEGEINVLVQVNKEGKVTETTIKTSQGNEDLDKAVIKAIKSVKWKPAKMNDITADGATQIRIRFGK